MTVKNHLPTYYYNVFPAKIFTKWLTYGKDLSELFEKREIVFILEGGAHLRYLSYSSPAEFYRELCRRSPEKLDIGAVYNYPPKERLLHSDFMPVQREFVIDIDLTDYDDVRTCCKEANVCEKCWKFAIVGVRILENALKKHFGFKNFIFLFSGRRGIHCWVGDEIARKMNNAERTGVVGYLGLTKDDFSPSGSTFSSVTLHPLLEDAVNILLNSKVFDDIMEEQDWLDNDEKFVKDYFEEPICGKILTSFELLDSRRLKWRFLKECYNDSGNNPLNDKEHPVFARMFKRFILKVVYPRLDVNVSSSTNHLLKSPFCVHPKTGTVAVPLDLERLESIKLESFPTVEKLVNEVQENCPLTQCEINNEKYRTTSLAPYVEIFEGFVNNCIKNQ